MITLDNSVTTIVSNAAAGSLSFTKGHWTFDSLLSVRGNLNPPVDVSFVGDGGVILVDDTGLVSIAQGANMPSVAISGFAVGLFVIGGALMLRFFITRMARAVVD
jgi:hypothetical protein